MFSNITVFKKCFCRVLFLCFFCAGSLSLEGLGVIDGGGNNFLLLQMGWGGIFLRIDQIVFYMFFGLLRLMLIVFMDVYCSCDGVWTQKSLMFWALDVPLLLT